MMMTMMAIIMVTWTTGTSAMVVPTVALDTTVISAQITKLQLQPVHLQAAQPPAVQLLLPTMALA